MRASHQVNEVLKIKKKILNLKPFLPGSLKKQWNVCGTPGCKCKDPKRPKRHGPYYQLSFSVGGKSSSFFVKKEDVVEVRRRIKRYKRYKELCKELIKASVDEARNKGFSEGEK